jgi:hypothetical protein
MNKFARFKCRNCECYHQTDGNYVIHKLDGSPIYANGHPENVCQECTKLEKFKDKALGCCKYEPRGNLEYLEYRYEKIKQIRH